MLIVISDIEASMTNRENEAILEMQNVERYEKFAYIDYSWKDDNKNK